MVLLELMSISKNIPNVKVTIITKFPVYSSKNTPCKDTPLMGFRPFFHA
jgi:hypothetical protein